MHDTPNTTLKMNLIVSAENLQNRTNQMKILNLKENQSYFRRQYDQTHKWMGNSEKTKTRMQTFVRTFQRATNHCMADYMKPSTRVKPNHFILHVGANDLNSNRPLDKNAKTIINLASELISDKFHVSFSSIILRAYTPELNK